MRQTANAVILLIGLVWLSAVGTIAYVAWYFLAKFW